MEIIGYFDENGKKFVILKDDNNFFVGKVNSDKIVFGFNDLEKDFILTVIKELTPTNKLVTLLPFKVNGNCYKTYYDCQKDLYVFEDASKEDLKVLNSLWNNQELFVAYDINKKVKDTFNRVLRIGKKLVVVTLISTTLLGFDFGNNLSLTSQVDAISINDIVNGTMLLSSSIAVDTVKKNKSNIKEVDELTLQDIEKLINDNEFLSPKEKEMILANPELFVDNLEYFDSRNIVANLSNLHCNYIFEVRDDNILGTYEYDKDLISCYGVTDPNLVEPYVFIHEFCHSLQNHVNFTSSWLIEGINTITNIEYCTKDEAYTFTMNYVKALCEIIGREKILECNYKEGNQVIIDALMEIIPDEYLANTLIGLIETAHVDCSYNHMMSKEELKSYEQAAYNLFSMYYRKKFDRDMNQDIIMNYYLDKDRFRKLVSGMCDMDEEILEIVMKTQGKYYFNSKNLNSDNGLKIELPTYANYVKYDIMDLEQALDEGLARVTDEGIIANGMYLIGDGIIYHQRLEVSEEFYTYVINDDNRYIDGTITR